MKTSPAFIIKLLAAAAAFTWPNHRLSALPQLERPEPLGAEFEGIITIYPDNDNTAQVRRYWLVPNTARIFKKPDGKLAFGLVHSGISGFDPDGITALLNVVAQPFVDQGTLDKARASVEQKAKSEGATTVTFSYISPSESTCRFLVGGQYLDWDGGTKSVIKGGSVDAGIAFQYVLSKATDVRALAQAGGDDTATFGVQYTMKFAGVGNRVHFRIDADLKELFTHLKVAVSASGWFGSVSGAAKTEWQKLQTDGAVKLTVLEGKKEDVDQYHAEDIMNKLFEMVSNRTGFFAKRLQPSGLPDAPGGGGLFGWGVSAGGGFESTDEHEHLTYEVDAQYTRDQEIVFGMNFPTQGDALRPYVKNLTDTNKPFPTSADYMSITQQMTSCRTANVKALKDMLNDGTIDKALYDELIREALTKGCYVNYGINQHMMLKSSNGFGSEVDRKILLKALILKSLK